MSLASWILFFSHLAFSDGETLHHYADLPDKVVAMTLKTVPRARQVELMGTAEPASLSVNGQSVTLKKVSAIKSAPGVWINGKKVESRGVVGRFFSEFAPQDQSEAVLQVYIQNSANGYSYELHLGSTFLDFPVERTVEITDDGAHEYNWNLSGPFTGQQLTINRAQVRLENGTAFVNLKTPAGDGVISGKLVNDKGVKRLINIPYTLKVKRGTPGEIVFSTKQNLDGLIELPRGGLRLEGISNPGATIGIGPYSTAADSDGRWSLKVKPIRESWTLPVVVVLKRKSFSKTLRFVCSTCTRDDFIDHWEIGINYGLTHDTDGYDLRSITLGARHRSGWRAGFRDMGMTSKGQDNYYYGSEFFAGYQFFKKPFDGPVWLEAGVAARHREVPQRFYGMFGPYGNNKNRYNSTAFYIRTEPLRFWKIFGAGAQWDTMHHDKGRAWLFLSCNYAF